MPTPIRLEVSDTPIRNAAGKIVFLVTETRRRIVAVETENNPSVQADYVPPECWEFRTWERERVTKEEFYVHEYAAKKKDNSWWFIAGIVLLAVGAVLTGGALVVAYGATTAVVVAKATLVAAVGVASMKKGYDEVKEPDEYELDQNTKLSSSGPHYKELSRVSIKPRTLRSAIVCPVPAEPTEPMGTTTTGPGTGTGTGGGNPSGSGSGQ